MTNDPISIPHEDIPRLSEGSLDFRSTPVAQVLFVACDDQRQPYRIATIPIEGGIRYLVTQNAPFSITVATQLYVDTELIEIASRVLHPYVPRDMVVQALEHAAQNVSLEGLHTTDAHESSGAFVIRRVIDRLELWKRLGHPDVNTRLWPFQSGLREYLLLTCFDQLGQKPEWIPLTQWLSSTDTNVLAERDSIRVGANARPDECAKAFVTFYNSRYGVRSAFKHFLRDILPAERRRVLLDSLFAAESPLPFAAGATRPFADREKEDLLFTMRNAFTHRGMSHTHLEDFPGDIAPGHFPTDVRMMGTRINRTRRVDWGVRDWPRVLEVSVLWGLVSYVQRLARPTA